MYIYIKKYNFGVNNKTIIPTIREKLLSDDDKKKYVEC